MESPNEEINHRRVKFKQYAFFYRGENFKPYLTGQQAPVCNGNQCYFMLKYCIEFWEF